MKRDAYAVEIERSAVFCAFDASLRTGARLSQGYTGTGCQILAGTGPQVIGVGVRDDGAFDGLPRIDVEVTGGAVKPAAIAFEKRPQHLRN